VRQPILTNDDLEKIRAIGQILDPAFDTKHARHDLSRRRRRGRHRRRARSPVRRRRTGRAGLSTSSSCPTGDRPGPHSDPGAARDRGVHHHLIRKGLRTSVGLVVESGEPREVHHFACLAGYGAEAINPYLAFETLIAIQDELPRSSAKPRS
jgi:glutamate synthase (NADPH) large chain